MSLSEQRTYAVLNILQDLGSKRIVDLGCGKGKLLKTLSDEGSFEILFGIDSSSKNIMKAKKRFQMGDQLPDKGTTIKLINGSILNYNYYKLKFDTALAIELIEHLSVDSLVSFENLIFRIAKFKIIIITTPNYEYNINYKNLLSNNFRNKSHKFEWPRSKFKCWCDRIGQRLGYNVSYSSIGPIDEKVGSPTQMAIFNNCYMHVNHNINLKK